MNEMNTNHTNQGVRNMKKTFIVVALAAVMVVAFAATAMAYGPIYNGSAGAYNPDFPGYLNWSYVTTNTAGDASSPHGNYTTSTSKCAVCHAVHRASATGKALTAWGGTVDPFLGGTTLRPFESCYFCHGTAATFTDKIVEFAVTATGTLSPHTTCGRCHTASPHGAGVSEYPLLASKLLNTKADHQLEVDLVSGNNGLVDAMFDLSNPALKAQGMTLGSGYLCVGCHGTNTNQHVFAVNEYGATPALHYTDNVVAPAHAAEGDVTGHRVWAGATDTWNLDGSKGVWFSGGGAHDYYLAVYVYEIGGVTRYFKVKSATTFDEVEADGETVITADVPAATVTGWPSVIAYNDAYGCGACHDATRTDGKLAFPHGYVDAAGVAAPKGTDTGASFLWMTIAEDADGAKTLLLDTAAGQSIDANKDGACLKCHLSGDQTAGVGVTY